eukprot:g1615.t1
MVNYGEQSVVNAAKRSSKDRSDGQLFRERLGFVLLSLIAFYFLVRILVEFKPVLEPFLWAVVIVCAVDPVVLFVETKILAIIGAVAAAPRRASSNFARSVAKYSSIIIVLGFILSLIMVFFFFVVQSARRMRDHWAVYETGADNLRKAVSDLQKNVLHSFAQQQSAPEGENQNDATQLLSANYDAMAHEFLSNLQDLVYSLLGSVLNNVGSLMFSSSMTVLYALFWLLGRRQFGDAHDAAVELRAGVGEGAQARRGPEEGQGSFGNSEALNHVARGGPAVDTSTSNTQLGINMNVERHGNARGSPAGLWRTNSFEYTSPGVIEEDPFFEDDHPVGQGYHDAVAHKQVQKGYSGHECDPLLVVNNKGGSCCATPSSANCMTTAPASVVSHEHSFHDVMREDKGLLSSPESTAAASASTVTPAKAPSSTSRSRAKRAAAASPTRQHLVLQLRGTFRRYLLLKSISCLGFGFAVGLWLNALQVDLAAVFGAITFVMNFVPEVGPFISYDRTSCWSHHISMVLPTPVILLDSRLERPFFTLLLALVGQILLKVAFANVIEVKLIENDEKLKMHPVIILLSVAVWGHVWGPTGMLLSVPLMAFLKISLLSEIVPASYRDPVLVLLEGDRDAPKRHRGVLIAGSRIPEQHRWLSAVVLLRITIGTRTRGFDFRVSRIMAMPPGVPLPADLLETFREKVVRDLFWALAGPNLSNVSIKQICLPLGVPELMMEPSSSGNFTLLSSLGRSFQESIAQLRAWDQDPLPLLKLLRERGGLSLRTLGHYFSTLLEVWFLSSPNVVGIKKGQTVRLRSDKTSTKVLRESQLKFLLFLRGKESVSDEKKAPESTPTIPEASEPEQGSPGEGEKAAPEQDFIDTPNLPLEASTGPVFHVEANIKFFVLTRSGSVKGPFLHESLQNRIEDIERKLELLHAVPELKSNGEKFSGYLLRGYVFHQIDEEDLEAETKADAEDAGETATEAEQGEDAGCVGATGAGRMRKISAEPAVEVANGHFEHAFEGGIRSQEETRTTVEASRENKKHDPASALDFSLLDAEHASGFLTRHVRNIAHESCSRPGFNVTTKYVVLPKLYWLSPLTGAPLRYVESGFRCRKDQADATVETAYLELFGSCQQILVYDTIDLLEKYAGDFFLRNKDIPIMVAVVEVLENRLHEVRRGFVLPHWWSPTNPEGHLLQIQNRARRAFPPKRESRTRARQRLEREIRQKMRNTAHGKCNLLLQEAWELAGGVVTLELGGTGRWGSGTIDLREEDAEEGSCSLGQKLRDAESGIIRRTEEELQRAGERTSPSEPTPAQSAALRVRWHRALEGMKRQLQMQAVGKKKGKRGYRHDHKARKCGGGVELEVERTDEKLREMEGGTGKTPRPMLQQELQQDAEACENESKPVVLDAEADPDPDAVVDADAITGTEKASSTVGTRTPAAPEDVKICVEWLLDAICDSSPASSRIEPLLLAKAFLQLFPYSTLAAAAHFREPAMPLVDDGHLCEQPHRKGKREEVETAESESKSAQDLQDAGRGEATGGGPESATSAAFTDKVARTVVQSRFRGDAKYDLRTCLAGPAGVRLLPALPLLGVFDIPADALPAFRSAVFSSPQKTALKVLSEFEAHHLTSAPEKESTDGYCRDPDYFGTKLVNEYFTHLQQRVRDPPPPVLGVDGTPVVERPRALEIGGIEPNYGHNMQQEAVVMPPDEQAVNTQHRKWEKFNTGASSDRDDHHRWLRLPPEVPIIVVEDVTRDAAPILTQEQDFFDEDNDAAASDGISGCKTQKYTVGLDCEWAPGFIGTGDLGVSLVQLAFPHCVLLVDFVAVGDETGQRLVSEILARFACRVVAFGKEDFRRLKLLRPTGDDSAESSLSNSATTSSRAYTGPSTAGTGAAASTCPESSRRSPGLGARVVTPVEVAAKFGFPLFGVGPFHPSNATPTSSRTPKNEKTRPRSTVFMDTRVTEASSSVKQVIVSAEDFLSSTFVPVRQTHQGAAAAHAGALKNGTETIIVQDFLPYIRRALAETEQNDAGHDHGDTDTNLEEIERVFRSTERYNAIVIHAVGASLEQSGSVAVLRRALTKAATFSSKVILQASSVTSPDHVHVFKAEALKIGGENATGCFYKQEQTSQTSFSGAGAADTSYGSGAELRLEKEKVDGRDANTSSSPRITATAYLAVSLNNAYDYTKSLAYRLLQQRRTHKGDASYNKFGPPYLGLSPVTTQSLYLHRDQFFGNRTLGYDPEVTYFAPLGHNDWGMISALYVHPLEKWTEVQRLRDLESKYGEGCFVGDKVQFLAASGSAQLGDLAQEIVSVADEEVDASTFPSPGTTASSSGTGSGFAFGERKVNKAATLIGSDRMRSASRGCHSHNYAPHYVRHLWHLLRRRHRFGMVEVGVLRGSGLAMWSDFFRGKATLFGFDLSTKFVDENAGNLRRKGAFSMLEKDAPSGSEHVDQESQLQSSRLLGAYSAPDHVAASCTGDDNRLQQNHANASTSSRYHSFLADTDTTPDCAPEHSKLAGGGSSRFFGVPPHLFHFDQTRISQSLIDRIATTLPKLSPPASAPILFVVDDGKHDSQTAWITFRTFIPLLQGDDWVYALEDCMCNTFVYLLQGKRPDLFIYKYWNGDNSDLIFVTPKRVEDHHEVVEVDEYNITAPEKETHQFWF